MDNPFDWDYLTTVPGPNEVFGPLAVIYLILFTAAFLGSIIVYNGGGRKLFPNPVLFRMSRKWAGIGIILFGLGLFFFVIRALQISPFTFGMRVWLWLTIVAVLVWIGYIAWDLRAHYPAALKEYESGRKREQYARASTATLRKSGVQTAPAGSRPVRRRRR